MSQVHCKMCHTTIWCALNISGNPGTIFLIPGQNYWVCFFNLNQCLSEDNMQHTALYSSILDALCYFGIPFLLFLLRPDNQTPRKSYIQYSRKRRAILPSTPYPPGDEVECCHIWKHPNWIFTSPPSSPHIHTCLSHIQLHTESATMLTRRSQDFISSQSTMMVGTRSHRVFGRLCCACLFWSRLVHFCTYCKKGAPGKSCHFIPKWPQDLSIITSEWKWMSAFIRRSNCWCFEMPWGQPL